MKLMSVVTAGLVAIAGLAPVALATPASAQRHVVVHKKVVRHATVRHRTRQVCTNVYRNHRRVRQCRTVSR